jgi:NAD(P)-dependent dehydrogenase (short-subunit alcohol dehydrogenase family)
MGLTIAEAFVRAGDHVVVADRDAARVAAAVAALQPLGVVTGVEADVSDEPSVEKLMQAAVKRTGTIDVLINCAGAYGKAHRPTHETPVDEWDLVLDSNLKGSFLCAKHVIPVMLAQRSGRIINFASNAARTASPLLGCSYTAAKAAVLGLTRHLAREYGGRGITTNTIAPGPVAGERVSELADAASVRSLASQIPLGRLATAADICGVVVFLASDAAAFMNGAIVDVNGGYVTP